MLWLAMFYSALNKINKSTYLCSGRILRDFDWGGISAQGRHLGSNWGGNSTPSRGGIPPFENQHE